MKWRPKNWCYGGGRYDINPEGNKVGTESEEIYEKGADDMLEALLNTPDRREYASFNKREIWVRIPQENE